MLEKIKIGIVGIKPHHKDRINLLKHHLSSMDIIAASGDTQTDLVFAKNEMGLQYCYDDHKMLSNNNDLDAILIWSDPKKHAIQAIAAIEANKHVCIDLPLATNVSDCQAIQKAASSKPSQMVFCPLLNRYKAVFIEANKLIDQGKIGMPVMAQLYHGEQQKDETTLSTLLEYRSIFIDLALNEIDLVRWFFGKDIQSVSAHGAIAKDKALKMVKDVDTAQVQCLIGDAAYAQLSISRFPINSADSRFFIQGTKGSILIDEQGLKYIHEKGVDHILTHSTNKYELGIELQAMQDFCQQVQHRDKGNNSLEDAAKTTEVAVAMAKSLIMKEKIDI